MKMKYYIFGVIAIASGILTGCADSRPATFYGTGMYHCLYENERTEKLYRGIDEEKKKATQLARHACHAAAVHWSDEKNCVFHDCIFK